MASPPVGAVARRCPSHRGLAMAAAGYTNPLRDARDRRIPRVPDPCALVVFGVTGDLARKKLLPAVYDLANRGLLPPGFALLGFSRRDWGDADFSQLAMESAQKGARTPWRDGVWERLAASIRFVPGAFDDDEAFDLIHISEPTRLLSISYAVFC